MEILMLLLQLTDKSLEFFWAVAGGLSVIGYGLFWLVKNFPKILSRLAQKIFSEDKQTHIQATVYRKKVVPKIKKLLSSLAEEIEADRAFLFEYSNGSSNLVGLPFLYLTATLEVLKPGMHSVINNYKKTNVSIISDFIEKVERDTFFYVKDLEEIKDVYPVMYSFMRPDGVKSMLFYAIYSEDHTIGFIVVTSVKKELDRKEMLPEVAAIAQAISSLLNYGTLKETLK